MQHWNSYWQKTKTLNSFAEGEQGSGYIGEVASFWKGVLGEIQDNATILDLASGNGGLAVLALQCNESFQVSASDQADIAPFQLFDKEDPNFKYLQKISFFGNMPSEHLTFSSSTFDVVISQFGFEYGNVETTLKQLHRILKLRGKFIAMIHHEDSFISLDCNIGLNVLRYFLSKDGLLVKANTFANCCEKLQQYSVLSLSQQDELKVQSSRLLFHFKAIQQDLSLEELEWFNVIAKDIVSLFSNWRRLNSSLLKNTQINLEYFRQRLSDQTSASWNSKKVNDFERLCLSRGFNFSISPMNTDEGLFCWVCTLTK